MFVFFTLPTIFLIQNLFLFLMSKKNLVKRIGTIIPFLWNFYHPVHKRMRLINV